MRQWAGWQGRGVRGWQGGGYGDGREGGAGMVQATDVYDLSSGIIWQGRVGLYGTDVYDLFSGILWQGLVQYALSSGIVWQGDRIQWDRMAGRGSCMVSY